jgi:hypothetical protein
MSCQESEVIGECFMEEVGLGEGRGAYTKEIWQYGANRELGRGRFFWTEK